MFLWRVVVNIVTFYFLFFHILIGIYCQIFGGKIVLDFDIRFKIFCQSVTKDFWKKNARLYSAQVWG